MRICRFNANRLGVIQGDQVFDVSGALAVFPERQKSARRQRRGWRRKGLR